MHFLSFLVSTLQYFGLSFNKIGKKSPRSSASVDELSLNFLEFSFAVSKIIIIFVA